MTRTFRSILASLSLLLFAVSAHAEPATYVLQTPGVV